MMSGKSGPGDTAFPLQSYYSGIYRKYDLVNRLFTFGMDRRWRSQASAACLERSPEKIIDLCCGTGDLALELRRQSEGRAAITGYDFSTEMLQLARAKADSRGYSDIRFIQGDAASMPFTDGEFDALTIGFGFRNLTYRNGNAGQNLAEMHRVLKNRALLCILESAVPSSPFIRFFYKLYLEIILIPLGGLITGEWKAYKYLARSSAGFFSQDRIRDLLEKSGFEVVRVRTFFLGSACLTLAVKK